MRRVHRTLLERLSYLAIYQCKECQAEDNMPRRYRLHLGKQPRCPKCGTFRISRLKEPDHIDPYHTGFLNLLERMAGGRLFHCRFCRIQFWDRRLTPEELAELHAERALEDEDEEAETPTSAGEGPDA